MRLRRREGLTAMPKPLPEPRPEVGQRPVLEGWPTPAAEVEPYTPRPAAYVSDPYGPGFMPVRQEDLAAFREAIIQAAQPQPAPAPGPLIDPIAQRLAGAGVLGAGVGWGASQVLSVLASGATGLVLALALLLALRLTGGGQRRGGDTYNTHVHQKWFGKINNNQ